MSRAIVCAVRPTRSKISLRVACSKNSSGSPNSFRAVSTPAARSAWRILVPIPPTRTPSSIVTTSRWSAASSTTLRFTGTTQRGSITVAPIPCAESKSATWSAVPAIEPTGMRSTSFAGASFKISVPSSRRRKALISWSTEPLPKRIIVGAS